MVELAPVLAFEHKKEAGMKVNDATVTSGLAAGLVAAAIAYAIVDEWRAPYGYGLMIRNEPPHYAGGWVTHVYISSIKCGSDALVGDDRLYVGDRIAEIAQGRGRGTDLTIIPEDRVEGFRKLLQHGKSAIYISVIRGGKRIPARRIEAMVVDWKRDC